MARGIEIPGLGTVETPSPEAQALAGIQQQLAQMAQMLNVVNGQLDMQIRLTVGAALKSEVKARFKENDERVRADMLAAQAAAKMEAVAEEDLPAPPE